MTTTTARLCVAALLALAAPLLADRAGAQPAAPQAAPKAAPQAAPKAAPNAAPGGVARLPAVDVPGFWDPKRRPDRPDVTQLPTQIRFVTTEDYPPFSFRGEDGRPAGFNVDIARAICQELAITCTLEIMPFGDLVAALDEGKADAAIAGIAITPESRKTVDFTDRYFRSPARFVGRRVDLPTGAGAQATPEQVTPGSIASKTVGVIGGTAHEAFLRDLFAETAIRAYPDAAALRAALRKGEVDLIFGDGVELALWLNGTQSQNCCAFVGGPFTESRYFGEGMGVAVKRGNEALRQSLNYAFAQLWEEGVYTDLYLRWFPISVY
ncbi:transporter substrate-binding domain-containing protein [Ancylobacter mangrovi]|uniref:transporter substrate-binding domain-containing protein n=1 Tax=Ancylobacter mangrovi TaxID=2972472 RepID=UPI00216201A4|nr:transporter substrate-binding domain-containing protein [Ancylobacter mangrovi]MCS0500966.1 transporter substrate-binding domain-containing protein [Ancylobacter mangrovi]